MFLVRRFALSPPIALACGYMYLIIGGIILFGLGFFKNNDFYRWDHQ